MGNWDAAHIGRRPLSESLACIESLAMDLGRRQALGAEVRLGTPVAFCCRAPVGVRQWTRKVVQLLGQGMRDAAKRYGVPIWDILQITTGREENTVTDYCNHYNSEMYHILLQVLCNSVASVDSPRTP